MSPNLKFNRGFTLIELVVVFSVIGILSVLGIAGFKEYNKVQTLQTAAHDVATTAKLAKSRALSQVKAGTQCGEPRVLKGYQLHLTKESGVFNRYRLKIHCVDSVGADWFYAIVNKYLPKNIVFGGTDPINFYFPVLKGGVETNGQIVLTGYGRTKTILIDSLGGVRVQ